MDKRVWTISRFNHFKAVKDQSRCLDSTRRRELSDHGEDRFGVLGKKSEKTCIKEEVERAS